MKETYLVKQIINYLNLKGHLVWRNQSGGRSVPSSNGRTNFIQFAPAGSPDIVGLTKTGQFIGVECKVGRNTTTELQKSFLGQIKQRKGLSIVAYSLDDVINQGL